MAADTNLTIGHNLLPKTSGNINLGDSTHKWVIDASQISGTVGSAKTATSASSMIYEADTANVSRNVWFSDSAAVGKLVYDDDFKYNPSTKILTVKNITGNTATATKFASNQSVALTGDVTGSASSQAGWSIATTLNNSGVTAGTYGPTANQTPAFGATFTVPKVVVDAKGRVTSAESYTVKIPAAPADGTGFASGSGSPASSQTAAVYVDTSVSTSSNPNPAGIYIRVS